MMALIAIRGKKHNCLNVLILQYYPAWIGMQIIHFKMLCVPVSTGTLKGDTLLKYPQIQSQTV